MENYKKKSLELISNLALEYKGKPAVIPYSPQKSEISGYERKSLKRSTPEHHGIPSEVLYGMLSELEKEERANVHSIVVTKGGEVISSASRPGYSENCFHLSHSMSKSAIGIVIGLLFDDGKLDTDTPIIEFFKNIPPEKTNFTTVTVHHLLTMSSGISFYEIGSVTDSEWTRSALMSEPDFPPGERFAYNSMNSYLLAAIAEKIVRESYGISLSEYIDTRLFAPLGIKNKLWEVSPEGIEKGGWGLYLSAESWAKIGIMMMSLGKYEGRRILSENWVKRSITTHFRVPDEAGGFNYGYQLWVSREGGEFLFNGMLGQNVWVYPGEEIVVSLNSGNNELFQESPALTIIRKHLGGEIPSTRSRYRVYPLLYEKERTFFRERSWIKPRAELHGLKFFLGLASPRPFPEAFFRILGKYDLPENNFGIMPCLVRVMQNNYQGGIDSLTFEREREILRLTSTEGGVAYTLNFGFYEYEYNVLELCGEKYIVLCIADSSEEGDGNIAYRLELIFPELPNTRRITLSLNEELLLNIKMTEIPDSRIANSFLTTLPAMNPRTKLIFDLLERNLGKNFISVKLNEQFSPEITAVRTDSDIYESYLAAERAKFERKVTSSRLIRSLINRFVLLGDEKKSDTGGADEDKKEEKPPGIGGILWSVISKIFS